MPEQSMPEVEAVVVPVKRLHELAWLATPVRNAWLQAVLKGLWKHYREITIQVLQQAHATRKFISERARGKTDAKLEGMEKIHTQFRLDALRLQSLLLPFGGSDNAASGITELLV